MAEQSSVACATPSYHNRLRPTLDFSTKHPTTTFFVLHWICHIIPQRSSFLPSRLCLWMSLLQISLVKIVVFRHVCSWQRKLTIMANFTCSYFREQSATNLCKCPSKDLSVEDTGECFWKATVLSSRHIISCLLFCLFCVCSWHCKGLYLPVEVSSYMHGYC